MPYSEWSIHQQLRLRIDPYEHIFGDQVILARDLLFVMGRDESDLRRLSEVGDFRGADQAVANGDGLLAQLRQCRYAVLAGLGCEVVGVDGLCRRCWVVVSWYRPGLWVHGWVATLYMKSPMAIAGLGGMGVIHKNGCHL
jgi:hypothetical protein